MAIDYLMVVLNIDSKIVYLPTLLPSFYLATCEKQSAFLSCCCVSANLMP